MSTTPALFGVALVLFFGSMGLPGLCGFVAEVFVTLAAFHFSPLLGSLTAFAVVLTAGYMLWAFRRVFQGPPGPATGSVFPDLSSREWIISIPLVVLTIALGIWPRLVLDWVSPSVASVADGITAAQGHPRIAVVPGPAGR